jgi:hypothetical protein
MARQDPRVTAYIAKKAPFARPILKHLRSLVHEGCPEAIETIKWGMPSFEYNGILCGMAAFKAHVTFGFWRGGEIVGKGGKSVEAMGQFGRITSLDDLPPRRELIGYVKKAAALNESGPKRATKPKSARPAPRAPADLKKEIDKSARARAAWDEFSPSAQRDYVEWVLEAKQPATRARRVATAAEWIAAGKRRHWKYESK